HQSGRRRWGSAVPASSKRAKARLDWFVKKERCWASEPSRTAVRVLVSRAARTRSVTATRAPRAARTAVAERPDGVGGGIADDDIADGSVADVSDADDFDVDGIAVGA